MTYLDCTITKGMGRGYYWNTPDGEWGGAGQLIECEEQIERWWEEKG